MFCILRFLDFTWNVALTLQCILWLIYFICLIVFSWMFQNIYKFVIYFHEFVIFVHKDENSFCVTNESTVVSGQVRFLVFFHWFSINIEFIFNKDEVSLVWRIKWGVLREHKVTFILFVFPSLTKDLRNLSAFLYFSIKFPQFSTDAEFAFRE